MRLIASCVAVMARRKHKATVVGMSAIQNGTIQDFAMKTEHRWPTRRKVKVRNKTNLTGSDFNLAEREGVWSDERLKPAVVQAVLSSLQHNNAGVHGANRAPVDAENVTASVQEHTSVERPRQNHFEDSDKRWDNGNSTLHLQSLHRDTKEADNWGRSEWVKDAPGIGKFGASSRGGTVSYEESTNQKATDPMPNQQDALSWTLQISQHSKQGQGRQALLLYDKMRESRVEPSLHTFVAALKACSSLQDLERAMQIHVEVVKSGYESNVYVGTMMVDVCCKCGSLVDARRFFEKIPERNVITWNVMILGYAQMQEGEEALQLYTRMQQEGLVPNDRTFVSALKACSSLVALELENEANEKAVKKKCLEQVRTIHLDVVKGGSDSSVFVGTMLVDVYAKCGSLVDARSVFEKMRRRDVVSWNAMMLGYAQMEKGEEALQLYVRMQQEGVVHNDRTFVGALKACSSLAALEEGCKADGAFVKKGCLEQVRAIHEDILKSGYESDIFVGNMLTDVYAKCGSLENARGVFDKMPRHNVVSWTAMISAYAQMDYGEEALHLYRQMQVEGIVPNDRTFIGVLKACSSLAGLKEGNDMHRTLVKKQCLELVRDIHSTIVKCGYDLAAFLGTMLVDVYLKCGSLVDARCVFEKMPHHDVVSMNAMILGYAQMDDGEKALQLYARMQEEGVVPNDRTFVGALKACSTLAASEEQKHANGKFVRKRCLEQVRDIHSQIMKAGSELDLFVGNMLVDVYAKCGSLMDARSVFEKVVHRDVVSWNAMILAYVQLEDGQEALQLYTRMQHEGVEPDERTFVVALGACGSVAGLGKGKEIHTQFLKSGLESTNAFVANSLIDMYGKCGSMVSAQQVFNGMATRDVVTWNALIAGYARQGQSELLFHLFEEMKQEGILPDSITFLSLLTVCSHVGLVDKGQKYFYAMSNEYGISPTIEHFICMVDLLGRAGQLNKAMKMAKTIPFQAPIEVWRCMLGNCQKWNNVEFGIQAFDCAKIQDQTDAASYVLMSNIYAAAHMWEEVKKIQAIRVKARAWKQPGQSWWTDMGGAVHSFLVGEREHPEIHHISAKLRQLSVNMKEDGCGSYPQQT